MEAGAAPGYMHMYTNTPAHDQTTHHVTPHSTPSVPHLDDCIPDKLITAAIRRVEVDAACKAQEKAVAGVGVGDVEGRVVHELPHVFHVARHAAAGLCDQPLEQHQRLLLVRLIELLQQHAQV